MRATTHSFTITTRGQGTYEITDQLAAFVSASGLTTGLATVFLQHTSASLVIYENADASAREDLHAFFARLVPEHERSYTHTAEGPDDTTSHLKMALTRSSESIPIAHGRLALGAWQGVFVFEHRTAPHRRQLVLSLLGV